VSFSHSKVTVFSPAQVSHSKILVKQCCDSVSAWLSVWSFLISYPSFADELLLMLFFFQSVSFVQKRSQGNRWLLLSVEQQKGNGKYLSLEETRLIRHVE
jgi:hypothetical protein